jgi:hypothetical protein
MSQSLTRGELDARVKGALAKGGVGGITTSGRRSGRPRRIEIVFQVRMSPLIEVTLDRAA